MKKEGTSFVVVAAVAANAAIAVSKLVAAALTSSSSMLAEAIHSVVDTGDGLLLWVGMKRSERPPDALHPFGYGKERYFWAMVVAMMVFGVGGGVSIYEGVLHLLHPAELTRLGWSAAVLGISAFFEASSWTVAAREFGRTRRGRGVWRTIRRAKDPASFFVLLEDSAALIGIALAATGIGLTHYTGWWWPDGVASILIGALLVAVAVVLAGETRELLLGESADPRVLAQIREIVDLDPDLAHADAVLTMHLGPEEVLLNIQLTLAEGVTVERLGPVLDRFEREVRRQTGVVTRIFVEPRTLGDEPVRVTST